MCGIIGICHYPEAEKQVKIALTLLQNRGKDGSKFLSIDSHTVVGHTLHAIINTVSQPLRGKGVLVANCEIYNWKELKAKYHFKAQNDAELLLQFLDKFDITKIEELDGVYAFAYWHDGKIYLARDLLGEKPLWFTYTTNGFAFVSEKKVLEKLGHLDIEELNPRHILIYNTKTKKLQDREREFFTYVPEHQLSQEQLQKQTEKLLDEAIAKRIPSQKFGLLFSGGIDSTYLAQYFKDKGYDFTCYTAVLEGEGKEASDFLSAKNVAKKLGLKLKIKKIFLSQVLLYLEKIVPLIEDSNVVKIGVALPFYLACEMAKEDGCKVIFSGLGSEEIFAGYERHKNSNNINQECLSGLRKIYERDLYRDDVITMDNSLELRLPFLDKKLIEFALKIPGKYKIVDNVTKLILRKIALKKGIPEEFAFRKKVAAQYGSKFDYALGKLAKKNGFSTKSSYLKLFYPSHNLKLGLLFSSGKDSLSAASIMKKQNYELTCLIHLQAKNKVSYMFQTAGTELIELQAEAMGLPILIKQTAGKKEEELKDLEKAIKIAKEKYKIDGIITGALFSTYQRDRIEKICDKLGLKIFSPLWHKPQEQHLREVVAKGFEVIITAVAAEGLDEKWLGRQIDEKIIQDLQKLYNKNALNVAGEGGEYETVVLNCSLFKKRIKIIKTEKIMEGKCSGTLLIKEAILEEK